MSLKEILHFRRSVRHYDPTKPIDSEQVKECIELATLAPTSSNMQAYEVIHITDKAIIDKLAVACFKQKAATTAQELVVFVTRQDLYKERARDIFSFEIENIKRNSPEARQAKRIKDRQLYYQKVMPFLYARFGGLLGLLRKIVVNVIGLFRPIYYQVSEADMRVVVHKSCGLVAQTFMIAMADKGYDTCPMEGFDSKMVRRILHLPRAAGINMIISCGIRQGNDGIYGERYRVPFEQIYTRR